MEANTNTFEPDNSSKRTFRPMPTYSNRNSVCVVGAGAFGGWTALSLQRLGYSVTLFDAWGAGNSRSSSGDETRVIRSSYGANRFYFDLNVRSLELWKENEQKFNRRIFHNTGVLWLCYEPGAPLIDDSIPFSKHHRMEYEYLSTAQIQKKYPLINCSDLHHAYLDPFGGYLKAREACQEVAQMFLAEGGTIIQDLIMPGKESLNRIDQVTTATGKSFKYDCYIFACGSWLPSMFPVLSKHIHCTKQAVFYLGTPPAQSAVFDTLPVWIDLDGKDFYYGIPGNSARGFKIGVDKRGAPFDPTNGERTIDPEVLEQAREFLAHRFPTLQNAPLLESRICPYENSKDGNFIFDIHPEAENVYFLGGGSGHGFKHGPGVGELVANAIAGKIQAPDVLRIF